MRELRKHPRHLLRAPVTLVISGEPPIAAELVDLSEGGCFFVAEGPLRTGWLVTLTLAVAGDRYSATGGIVRSADGRGFGVEFARLGAGLSGFLSALGTAEGEERRRLVQSVREAQLEIAAR